MDRMMPPSSLCPSWQHLSPEQREATHQAQMDARTRIWQCRTDQVKAEANRRCADLSKQLEILRNEISETQMARTMLPINYGARAREWVVQNVNEEGNVSSGALVGFLQEDQRQVEADTYEALRVMEQPPAQAPPAPLPQPQVSMPLKRSSAEAFSSDPTRNAKIRSYSQFDRRGPGYAVPTPC